jgi:hypothetical protein
MTVLSVEGSRVSWRQNFLAHQFTCQHLAYHFCEESWKMSFGGKTVIIAGGGAGITVGLLRPRYLFFPRLLELRRAGTADVDDSIHEELVANGYNAVPDRKRCRADES